MSIIVIIISLSGLHIWHCIYVVYYVFISFFSPTLFVTPLTPIPKLFILQYYVSWSLGITAPKFSLLFCTLRCLSADVCVVLSRELTSTASRLCRHAYNTKQQLEKELKQLDTELHRLQAVASSAETLRLGFYSVLCASVCVCVSVCLVCAHSNVCICICVWMSYGWACSLILNRTQNETFYFMWELANDTVMWSFLLLTETKPTSWTVSWTVSVPSTSRTRNHPQHSAFTHWRPTTYICCCQ